jgi:hypothetical protein
MTIRPEVKQMMKKPMPMKKGVMPAGMYADGGAVNMGSSCGPGYVPDWSRQNMSKGGATGVPKGNTRSTSAFSFHTPKVRGYADGGEVNSNPFQGDDVDPFSAARDSRGSTAPSVDSGMMEKEPGWDSKTEAAAPAAEPAKPMKFGEAFSAARKAGQKTFEWQGKKYTTEMASDKPKAAPKAESPKPSASLAQSKGKEFAEYEKIARDAESNPEFSRAAKAAARANADRARKVYEDAAAAEREGTSVVRKR